MNISIIFTGGTIGSLTKKEWVSIDNTSNYMLLEHFAKKESDITFAPSSPYSILSENLSATELNALQDEIAERLAESPDGIIITHGTDTLQYTAAAVEYAFANVDIPIVFVSADYPLDNPKTNGHANFEAAVAFIQSGRAKGVFASYKNAGDPVARIHIASRLRRHSENSANIYSLGSSVCATYENGELHFCEAAFADTINALGAVCYTEQSHILSIDSEPGNSYAYVLDDIKAIIIKPYHSATLNTMSEGLANLCRRAHESGIPVFVSGVKEGVAYESTKAFDGLNIRIAPYSTYVALYMKLWAAISLNRDVVAFAETSIANEWVE